MRIARGALGWGTVASVAGAAVAWLARGPEGAISVAIAAGLILGNVALTALISMIGARTSNVGAAMMALPSFAIRMSLMFTVLVALDGRPFIDDPSFVVAFCGALTLVLVSEARTFKRTPWIAMSFGEKERA